MNTTNIKSVVIDNNLTTTKSDIKKLITAKAVRDVFSCMPAGTVFYGWELKEKCVALYPDLKNVYVETFLRSMRAYCHNKYLLVSRSKSKYMRIADNAIDHAAQKYLEEKRLQEGR